MSAARDKMSAASRKMSGVSVQEVRDFPSRSRPRRPDVQNAHQDVGRTAQGVGQYVPTSLKKSLDISSRLPCIPHRSPDATPQLPRGRRRAHNNDNQLALVRFRESTQADWPAIYLLDSGGGVLLSRRPWTGVALCTRFFAGCFDSSLRSITRLGAMAVGVASHVRTVPERRRRRLLREPRNQPIRPGGGRQRRRASST